LTMLGFLLLFWWWWWFIENQVDDISPSVFLNSVLKWPQIFLHISTFPSFHFCIQTSPMVSNHPNLSILKDKGLYSNTEQMETTL
jgi:hypothetical protein